MFARDEQPACCRNGVDDRIFPPRPEAISGQFSVFVTICENTTDCVSLLEVSQFVAYASPICHGNQISMGWTNHVERMGTLELHVTLLS